MPTTQPLRVDHTTVVRDPQYQHAPSGLAAQEGTCPHCGDPVEEDEPISLVGSYVEQDEDGHRTLDLSGAIWICQKGTTS